MRTCSMTATDSRGAATQPMMPPLANLRCRVRILLVNYEYPPLGGGGGVAMQDLAQGLAARHEVVVLTSGAMGLPAEEVRGGAHIVRLAVPLRRKLTVASLTSMFGFASASCRRTARALGGFQPDLVNTWFAIPSGLLGGRLARYLRCPEVLTIIGGDIYDPSRPLSPHRWRVLRRIVRGVIRRADRVCAISSDVRDRAGHYYGAPVADIPVIPLGFAAPVFAPATRGALGLPPEAFIITSVGRLVARKASDRLIIALAQDRDPRMHLCFVGDGPCRPELEALAAELGVGERVHFAGRVDEHRKHQLLAASDVFALASLHEGFGLVYLEAMRCGLPVVSNLDGGQRDFLQDGVNARIVADNAPAGYARAFAELAADADLRQRLSAGARVTASGATVEAMIEAYEALFEATLRAREERR